MTHYPRKKPLKDHRFHAGGTLTSTYSKEYTIVETTDFRSVEDQFQLK